MRALIADDPFLARTLKQPYWEKGAWRCLWVGPPPDLRPPFVLAFRKRFEIPKARTLRVHVTADERYELFLDGVRIGRGSERGDTNHWYFETYDLKLSSGPHLLVARVWALGDLPPGHEPEDRADLLGSSALGALAPTAQLSSLPGFLLAPQDEKDQDLLGTGLSAWDCKALGGYGFKRFHLGAQLTGAKLELDGAAFDWGFEAGAGADWRPAVTLHAGVDGARVNDRTPHHLLRPAQLPPMHHAAIPPGTVRHAEYLETPDPRALPVQKKNHDAKLAAGFAGFLKGRALVVPPHARCRAIVDLNEYYCAYHGVEVSGGAGARVRLHWAEALFTDAPPKGNLDRWCPRDKGHRGHLEGKRFVGMGDCFTADGGPNRRFESLWWHAGRYVEVLVETAAEPLTLLRPMLHETRYPLENEARFASSDAKLAAITPMMLRAMQACAHETFVDCPYYEQLMYAGDTRLECLATYVMTHDARLPQKAVRLFEASRLTSGLTQSRYPCRIRQVIPTFSLWWIGMVRDAVYWREGAVLARQMLPGVRGVLENFMALRGKNGLVAGANGWNYMDWVPGWANGIPPGGEYGASGLINWLFALALGYAADLEDLAGDRALAARNRRVRGELARALEAGYWDAKRGLFAEEPERRNFSEHSQCLALLTGCVSPEKKAALARTLFTERKLARTTIFFMHYLFEACRLLGRLDVVHQRLGLWRELKALDFKTTFECPEPSRSDCHGWGAHPYFHYFASILGIRPAAPGFAKIEIVPRLAHLKFARGTMPHPRGEICVNVERAGRTLRGTVELPKGITGVLKANGACQALAPGRNRFKA